ncbi:MAG: LamG-like jellyroll fold domain-containing protein, partial [Patescibacteria group bacterium]|nr:LamG-like jellyroll fold domain-containing protein [Patescibacteria group bacterium]
LQLTRPGRYTGDTVVAAGTLQLGLAAGVDGAQLWLDANGGNVITNASGVTQWLDQSGNGRNATAAGLTNAVATTNALVNNMGVVRFNGTDQHLSLDLSFLANSGYTILAVEGRTGTGNHYYLGTYNVSTANQALHIGYRSDTRYTLAQYSNDLDVTVAGYGSQQFRVWANMLNLATNQQAIYRDGALLGSRTASGALTAAGNGRLGTGFSDQWFNGDLGEILIFDRALTASERAFVEEYLMLRWLDGGSSLNNILPTDTNLLVGGSATFDLGGTSQTVASLADYAGSGGTVSNHAATTATLTIAGNATTQFSGVLADGPNGGMVNLVHGGTGTLMLTGDNTYSGTTSVTGGSLLVNGTHAGAGQYLVTGGTLGGTGSIGGVTTIAAGGTLAPGASIGTMTFTEGLSLEDGATLEWEFLATDTVGQQNGQYDTIQGTDLFLPESGTVNLSILGLEGYSLAAGDRFTLFHGDVYQGTTLLTEGTDISHLFNISDNIGWWGTWQVTAGSLVLTAVPEPGTPLLLLSALALLLGRRKRKLGARS